MFLRQNDFKLSMYKNWQQLPVNPAEAKLNLLLMGGCSLKRRTENSNGFIKYSVALGDMGTLRMTHSSFWQYSKKVEAEAEKAKTAEKLCRKEISTQTTLAAAPSKQKAVVNLTGNKPEAEEKVDRKEEVPKKEVEKKVKGWLWCLRQARLWSSG